MIFKRNKKVYNYYNSSILTFNLYSNLPPAKDWFLYIVQVTNLQG